MIEVPLGEKPELPIAVIEALHQRFWPIVGEGVHDPSWCVPQLTGSAE